MLESAIGNPCPYCGLEITKTNASVDHKTPRTGSKVFNRKTRTMGYSYKQIAELDKEENLHIVCKDCNQLKGDMDDGQFKRFLEWGNQNQDVLFLIKKRFNLAELFQDNDNEYEKFIIKTNSIMKSNKKQTITMQLSNNEIGIFNEILSYARTDIEKVKLTEESPEKQREQLKVQKAFLKGLEELFK